MGVLCLDLVLLYSVKCSFWFCNHPKKGKWTNIVHNRQDRPIFSFIIKLYNWPCPLFVPNSKLIAEEVTGKSLSEQQRKEKKENKVK